MSASKPIVCFCDEATEWLVYSEDDFKRRMPKFEVISIRDVINNPELANRVQGLASTPSPNAIAKARHWIPKMPRLEAIVSQGAGKNHIEAAFGDFGIPVANTPDAFTVGVADHTMALVLASGCGLVASLRSTIYADKPRFLPPTTRHRGVHGTTMGIVGLGAIGCAVARRARGFDMTILYHCRRRKTEALESELGVTYCPSLDEMLPHCDYVVLCCDLNAGTRGLFSWRQFEVMKSSACLVNVSRGQVVDQEALVAALQSGGIGQAALDVTYPEPLPPGHPLLKLNNVIITTHSGPYTYESLGNALDVINENFEEALIYGREMPHLVGADPEIPEPEGRDIPGAKRPPIGVGSDADSLYVCCGSI